MSTMTSKGGEGWVIMLTRNKEGDEEVGIDPDLDPDLEAAEFGSWVTLSPRAPVSVLSYISYLSNLVPDILGISSSLGVEGR
jgi:hypothetical protein